MKYCLKDLHIFLSVYILATFSAFADQQAVCPTPPTQKTSIGRAPANFVPDDDLIVVPMVIEKNIYERFNEKHEEDFKEAREKLAFWITQEEYAKAYGLEDTGAVDLPTQDERERFLQRNYLRFLSKDVERSTNGELQDTLRRWTADDELDAIEMQEKHEEVLVRARKERGGKVYKKEKEVKVGEERIKFGFQPRLEIGMVKIDMETPYFEAKAWLGVNGNQEINFEKKIRSWGSKFRANYEIDQSRLLCAYDQRLIGNLSLRFSHTKDMDGFSRFTKSGIEDNVTQLRFGMRF
ncbi:MAG: hypothetical protein CME62_14220 [Halobacteriovoraceae bacterium]|nr:hypothetical protein [Halobacteriovoraceae bacterium]|tara:strand:+ start:22175 stop:23056 length:882 start_codon:yes stop_codon:yes gene_type:complete